MFGTSNTSLVAAGTDHNLSTEAAQSAGEEVVSLSGETCFYKARVLENLSLGMFFTRDVASGNTSEVHKPTDSSVVFMQVLPLC